jgi:HD-GYP domain-containing protein (c-di-GMP phosphodiesterase class II)
MTTTSVFAGSEAFGSLSLSAALNTNLDSVLKIVTTRYGDMRRISVAAYDEMSGSLKAHLTTAGDDEPMSHHEARLVPENPLYKLKESPQARIVRRLDELPDSFSARRLLEYGVSSSYAVPMFEHRRFLGVVFFASSRKSRFDSPIVRGHIDVVAKLIEVMLISEAGTVRGLIGTANTLKDVASLRDNETGEHLERMARYSRIVARHLEAETALSDEYIEDLFNFAPLHDIGKIAIPDSILLKPGALSVAEFDVMKTHASKGLEIVDQALHHLNLRHKHYSEMLRNIVLYHHENWDGSGYPTGLQAEAIPLEARIVRVADVYDALTSVRPYKDAWSSEEAFGYLGEQAGRQFDRACVAALFKGRREVEAVAQTFSDQIGCATGGVIS